MGRRGPLAGSVSAAKPRARTAAQEKRLGNPSRRPIRPDDKPTMADLVASGPSQLPVPPESLGTDGTATYKAAQSLSWVSNADLVSVLELCRTLDDLAAMRELVATEGRLLQEPICTARGDVAGIKAVSHPLTVEIDRAARRVERLAGAIGMTAQSRARLGLAVAQTQSAYEAAEAKAIEQVRSGLRNVKKRGDA